MKLGALLPTFRNGADDAPRCQARQRVELAHQVVRAHEPDARDQRPHAQSLVTTSDDRE